MKPFFHFNYNQLILYGVHVGHNFSNTLLFSSWMIFAFRQNISIVNLFKTVIMFRFSFSILSTIISFYGPVWFVNLDKIVSRYIKFASLNCGEFCITSRWIRGMLSNYPSIFNTYRRLRLIAESARSKKQYNLDSTLKHFFLSRYTWPRSIFVSSMHNSYAPIYEARILKMISIAIVDTNTITQTTPVAIPGNDESLECIVFYNDLISNFILLKKFEGVVSWSCNLKSRGRIIKFSEWLSFNYRLNIDKSSLNLITFNLSITDYIYKGMAFFLSKNVLKSNMKEKLQILNISTFSLGFISTVIRFLIMKDKFLTILNVSFFKKFLILRKFFKKKFLTEQNFNIKFLLRNFFKSKFLTDNYTKDGIRFYWWRKKSFKLLSKVSRYYFSNFFIRSKVLSKVCFNNVENYYLENLMAKITFYFIFQIQCQVDYLQDLKSSVLVYKKFLRLTSKKNLQFFLKLTSKTSYKPKFFVGIWTFENELPFSFWFQYYLNLKFNDRTDLDIFVRDYFFVQTKPGFSGFLKIKHLSKVFDSLEYLWI